MWLWVVLLCWCLCSALSDGINLRKSLKESQIHYIHLPPAEYKYTPGVGYISVPDSSIRTDIVKRIAVAEELKRVGRKVGSAQGSLNAIHDEDILRPGIKFRSNARPALAQQSYRRLDSSSPLDARRLAVDASAYKYKPEPKPKAKKRLANAASPRSSVVPLRILLPTRMNGMPSVLAHFQYPFHYRPVQGVLSEP